MSDRIDLGPEPWKAIPRAALRDKRLSAAAKGGLVTLLSHEDGWVRSVIAILMKENRRCGREQAQSIMRELVANGYAELHQQRKAGKFATAYTIHPASRSEPGTSLSPSPVYPSTVEPPTVNPSAVVEPQDVEPREEEPQGSTTSVGKPPRAPDPIWDALVDCYGLVAHDAERGRRNRAVGLLRQAGAEADEILEVHQSATTHRDDYVRRMAATPIAFATNWSDIRRVLTEVDPDSFEARLARGNKMLGVADG